MFILMNSQKKILSLKTSLRKAYKICIALVKFDYLIMALHKVFVILLSLFLQLDVFYVILFQFASMFPFSLKMISSPYCTV